MITLNKLVSGERCWHRLSSGAPFLACEGRKNLLGDLFRCFLPRSRFKIKPGKHHSAHNDMRSFPMNYEVKLHSYSRRKSRNLGVC